MSLVKELFDKYEISYTDETLTKFEKFLEIFKETNSQINLSAIRDDKWIIEKHFIDSLKLTEYIDLEWKGADIWTGWGFPGIPLKIFYGDKLKKMTLVDSVAKKINVVNKFCEDLELSNIKWKVARAEKLWKDWEYREQFDFVVSRAVAYFPTVLEYTLPLVKEWGYFIAFKLPNEEEINEGLWAIRKLGWKIVKTEIYEIDGQERCFVFIEKVKKTPPAYPREIWEAKKNPLK